MRTPIAILNPEPKSDEEEAEAKNRMDVTAFAGEPLQPQTVLNSLDRARAEAPIQIRSSP